MCESSLHKALLLWQAAPAAAEKANGVAAAAVQAVQQEATPSHDVYGHLPKPEENDKVWFDACQQATVNATLLKPSCDTARLVCAMFQWQSEQCEFA